MDAAALRAFANQAISGVTGLTKSVEESMKSTMANMSKEGAEKFAEALKDSGVLDIVKENTEKLKELNKRKRD